MSSGDSEGTAGDDGDRDAARVRVRGIYATALTRLLTDRGHEVVQGSAALRDRFDVDLPPVPADVGVATTRDRQGVGVEGRTAAVDAVGPSLRAVGVDALAWSDPAPTGAVFDARVASTGTRGAVLDLGPAEGYLPFDRTDDYVEEGDALRVQVRSAVPPWDDDRPLCDPVAVVESGLARLVPGEDESGAALELASVLPADPREGWAIRWDDAAEDADLDALAATLERLNDRAADVDALGEEVGDPGRLTEGRATTWVWFGRASRFALDDHRRAVTATMAGHHRCKAATEAASAAVDFAEAVCGPESGGDEGAFPFAALTRQFGPREGDEVAIGHGKPDGRLIVLGEGEVTDYDPDGGITVRRRMTPGGTYDALGVERRSGDVAVTKFQEGRWWYPTVYRSGDGRRRGTYVNVCTPVELFPEAARYVDLHVDVVKHGDGTVERVDDDELDAAVAADRVSEPLAERARSVAGAVESALRD